MAAFPPDGLPQPLLNFLGLKASPSPRHPQANGPAASLASGLASASSAAPIYRATSTARGGTDFVTIAPRVDTDGYVLSGLGMAKFDPSIPPEPNEALREAIKLGDSLLCTQLLAAKVRGSFNVPRL